MTIGEPALHDPAQAIGSDGEHASDASLWLATLAALMANGTLAANYWLIGLLVLWIFPAMFLKFVAAGVACVAVVLASVGLFSGRRVRAVSTFAVVAAGTACAFFVPYDRLNVLADFHLIKSGKDDLVAILQQPIPPFAVGYDWGDVRGYVLPYERAHLAVGDQVFVAEVSCGRFVFLPTFFGMPDGAGGFLYVPPCAKPEAFPRVLGSTWFSIVPLAQGWYRIDGS